MMQPHADPGRPPSPKQLAAYADGELDGAARAEVEAWLAGHPEAEAEVEAQRRLAQLWQTAGPCEPSEAEWAAVLARIEFETRRHGDTETRRHGDENQTGSPGRGVAGLPRRFWAALIALTAAAAVLLAVGWYGLYGPVSPQPAPAPQSPVAAVPSVQPLPVVQAHEVEIISLDDADSVALVVGEPPVPGPLVLVSVGDVTLENEGHGMGPWSQTPDDPTSPMILAPQNARSGSESNR